VNPREWLGKQIREYHLTDIMGSGGMSAVFRATHVRLQVERAIKVLRPDLSGDPEFVQRFEQEARILAVLEHPNLIRIFEFFEDKGFLFIVMEIVSGDSLEDLVLYHGVIPARKMSEILHQAAQGLYYAHCTGIVHRDLSPDNIMITGYDDHALKVKVIDFGIARQVAVDSESGDLLVNNAFIGKLRYCSPEQALSRPVDHRSDQYSMALIFLESVTGKTIFQEETTSTALMRRMHETPPRLADLIPGAAWPPKLDDVINRAMQIDPDRRYPSILEFADSLSAALEREDHRKTSRKPVSTENGRMSVTDSGNRDVHSGNGESGTGKHKDPPDGKHPAPEFQTTILPRPEPRYGRVPPPKPPKKLPWMGIILFSVILGLFLSYFFVPDKERDWVESKVNHFLSAGYNRVIDMFVDERKDTPPPTPYQPPALPKISDADSGDDPYWYKKAGVTPPAILNSGPVTLPRHMHNKFTTPVEVGIQCSILKDGTLGRCTVIQGVDPELDAYAMEILQSWTFRHGSYLGQPADIIMDITVVFN
jgi:serine/threonine protein kinase